jgi:mannose-binding lectin 2
VFGNEDFFNGLGIFLDTYANQNGAHNHGHPYINAMVNNGTAHYDHDRDGTHTEVSGCEAKIRGSEHDTLILIRYENDVLTVKTNVEGTNEYQDCFQVKGVTLPTGYFIGMTAATGDLSDNHYVISVRTFELDVPGAGTEDRSQLLPTAEFAQPERPHSEDAPQSMSSFKFFLLILCAIIGVVLVIAVGILIMNKRQETTRKRFY